LCQNSKSFCVKTQKKFENYETFLLLGKNIIYADFSFHKSNKVLIAKILWYFFLIIILRLYIYSFMCFNSLSTYCFSLFVPPWTNHCFWKKHPGSWQRLAQARRQVVRAEESDHEQAAARAAEGRSAAGGAAQHAPRAQDHAHVPRRRVGPRVDARGAEKEKLRKERRRLQEQLRRVKRNEAKRANNEENSPADGMSFCLLSIKLLWGSELYFWCVYPSVCLSVIFT